VKFTATSTYSVTFTESGIASGSGLDWEAYVGSTVKSSAAGSVITFSGLAGSNSYTVPSVIVSETCSGDHTLLRYYVASPGSGTVSGAGYISVTFTLTSKVVPGCGSSPASGGVSSNDPGGPGAAAAPSSPRRLA
jgi:hypothetical protein